LAQKPRIGHLVTRSGSHLWHTSFGLPSRPAMSGGFLYYLLRYETNFQKIIETVQTKKDVTPSNATK
jgi:hypothetical protein